MKENKVFEYILIGLSVVISLVAMVLAVAYSNGYYDLKNKDAKTKEMAVNLAESKDWFDYSYTIEDNWDEEGRIRHLVTYYYTLEGDDTTYKVEYIFGDKVEEVIEDLRDTSSLMASENYKDRFAAEYWQIRVRTLKLEKLIRAWEQDKLDFTPICSMDLLKKQLKAMQTYLEILDERAIIEQVDIAKYFKNTKACSTDVFSKYELADALFKRLGGNIYTKQINVVAYPRLSDALKDRHAKTYSIIIEER